MGMQCPTPNSTMNSTPVSTFSCTVMIARMGAMKPKVHEPESTP